MQVHGRPVVHLVSFLALVRAVLVRTVLVRTFDCAGSALGGGWGLLWPYRSRVFRWCLHAVPRAMTSGQVKFLGMLWYNEKLPQHAKLRTQMTGM